jgi:hypothetical protein
VVASVSLDAGGYAVLELFVEPPHEISGLSRVTFNVSAYSESDLNVSASNMVSLSIERPDLLFLGSGIRMSPGEPKDGQRVRLTVTVLNQGFWDSPRTTLSLLVDGKSAGEVAVPPIVMAAQVDVTFNWTAKEGTHSIKAVLNPDGQVKELTYENNEVTQNVLVGAPGTEVAWWLVGAFAVFFGVVLVAYFVLSRSPRGKKKRRPRHDEDEESEEAGGKEAEEEAEETEEGGGGEAGDEGEEDAGEEEAGEESGAEEAEAVDVEAVEVVEEEEPRPRAAKAAPPRKKAPSKKRRPPIEPKEVDMPSMMRIG